MRLINIIGETKNLCYNPFLYFLFCQLQVRTGGGSVYAVIDIAELQNGKTIVTYQPIVSKFLKGQIGNNWLKKIFIVSVNGLKSDHMPFYRFRYT